MRRGLPGSEPHRCGGQRTREAQQRDVVLPFPAGDAAQVAEGDRATVRVPVRRLRQCVHQAGSGSFEIAMIEGEAPA